MSSVCCDRTCNSQLSWISALLSASYSCLGPVYIWLWGQFSPFGCFKLFVFPATGMIESFLETIFVMQDMPVQVRICCRAFFVFCSKIVWCNVISGCCRFTNPEELKALEESLMAVEPVEARHKSPDREHYPESVLADMKLISPNSIRDLVDMYRIRWQHTKQTGVRDADKWRHAQDSHRDVSATCTVCFILALCVRRLMSGTWNISGFYLG